MAGKCFGEWDGLGSGNSGASRYPALLLSSG